MNNNIIESVQYIISIIDMDYPDDDLAQEARVNLLEWIIKLENEDV